MYSLDLEIVQNTCMTRSPLCLTMSLLGGLVAVVNPMSAQTPPAQPAVQPTPRPVLPARDPNTPGYVAAKELPDGANPPANTGGNFIIGPTHEVPSAASADNGIPKGTVIELTMNSS